MAQVPAKKPVKRKTQVVIAKKRRAKFLEELRRTCKVNQSAIAVGFKSANQLHTLRRQDEDFAAEWAEALEAGAETLVDEAVRRGRDGVMRNKWHKGKIVGEEIEYSDQLLIATLKATDPRFRETANRGGDTNINFGVAIMPMTAVNEGDWEKRAVDMHNNQTVIEIEAKPVENHMKTTERGS